MTYEPRNRSHWDAAADEYQRMHGGFLARSPDAWGVWRIPDAEIGAIGEVAGRDVLEYGCGAGQWSLALAKRGGRPVGFDLSQAQLRHAVAAQAHDGTGFPLVCGSGEDLPFAAGSFDVVFCDHGAMTFADPYRTVPEVARVLRRGGALVFCHATPLRIVSDDGETASRRLHRDYFGMHRFDWDGSTTVEYQLAYGEWIRLFGEHGLLVESLAELRAPKDATTSFDYYLPVRWARRWPGEQVWRVRKA